LAGGSCAGPCLVVRAGVSVWVGRIPRYLRFGGRRGRGVPYTCMDGCGWMDGRASFILPASPFQPLPATTTIDTARAGLPLAMVLSTTATSPLPFGRHGHLCIVIASLAVASNRLRGTAPDFVVVLAGGQGVSYLMQDCVNHRAGFIQLNQLAG
jgi:hypothetical protein